MDFDRLNELAFSLMGRRKAHHERETGFIYEHGQRVANLSLELRRRLFPDDASFDDVLRCAAIFHDLGKGVGEHGHTGALLARDALKDLLTGDELDVVCDLIRVHNKRRPDDESVSPAARLLQDADVLDHFGSCEVWLNVSYSRYLNQNFRESLAFYKEQWPDEVRKCRESLNFELSKVIFDDKIAFSNLYAARLEKESRGEIFLSI